MVAVAIEQRRRAAEREQLARWQKEAADEAERARVVATWATSFDGSLDEADAVVRQALADSGEASWQWWPRKSVG